MKQISLFVLLSLSIVVLPASLVKGSGDLPTLKTWQAMKREGVVAQGLDYSCGSASIATILNYYFGDNWREGVIIYDMTARLTEDETKDRIKEGFSMLDMKETLIRLGYQAMGVKLSLEQAKRLSGPVVILLRKDGINHFVVLRGIRYGEAYIADPSMGKYRLLLADLQRYWQGEALVIGRPGSGLPKQSELAIKDYELYHPEAESIRVWRYYKN